jgi:hypothetical protein
VQIYSLRSHRFSGISFLDFACCGAIRKKLEIGNQSSHGMIALYKKPLKTIKEIENEYYCSS